MKQEVMIRIGIMFVLALAASPFVHAQYQAEQVKDTSVSMVQSAAEVKDEDKPADTKQDDPEPMQDTPVVAQETSERQDAPVEPPVAPEPATQAPTTPQATGCDAVNGYAWDTNIAYAVCMGESGGNARAANMGDRHGSCNGSFGLMQVACIHYQNAGIWGEDNLFDPAINVKLAYKVYSESRHGNPWMEWGAYSDQRYLKYLH